VTSVRSAVRQAGRHSMALRAGCACARHFVLSYSPCFGIHEVPLGEEEAIRSTNKIRTNFRCAPRGRARLGMTLATFRRVRPQPKGVS
jgi:hypothetical protein